MKKFSLSLSLILLLSISCLAQDGVSTKVDDYIRREMQAQQIPGLVLAVIKDGQIVIARGYGLASIEHQVPVKPETIFQSGSTGKQFTATAVMMLVEEGKLSLDDKILKYFPDGPEAWQNITVRHLLTHTSGMTDYPKDSSLWFRVDAGRSQRASYYCARRRVAGVQGAHRALCRRQVNCYSLCQSEQGQSNKARSWSGCALNPDLAQN